MLPRSRLVLVLVALLVSGVGIVLVLYGLGFFGAESFLFSDVERTRNLGFLVMAAASAILIWAVLAPQHATTRSATTARVRNELEQWNERFDLLPPRSVMWHLILVTALGLFAELTLIRWLAAEIKLFAYLKNVVLIAAFLGLGLGYFSARHRVGLFPLFLPLLLLLCGAVALGAQVQLWNAIVLPASEQLALLGLSLPELRPTPLLLRLVTWIPYYALTLMGFGMCALIFIPLGQYAGRCMSALSPLRGYSLNLLGSLAGTLLFTLLAFLWLPPMIWFAVIVLLTLLLLYPTAQRWWRPALVVAALVVIAPGLDVTTTWSPYNKIQLKPTMLQNPDGTQALWGYQLRVAGYYYQDLLDLSPEFFREHPTLALELQNTAYLVPYQFAKLNDVLILGAGTGTDTAAALRSGAQKIDAVEIDPAILYLGRVFHPEHPYASPRVNVTADDARSFLRHSSKQYDLVVFGFLDSQQVLSAFGSVRHDNFVYTREGLQDAFARVRDGGTMAIVFGVFEPWMTSRMNELVAAASGQTPLVMYAHEGFVFLVRKGNSFTNAEAESAIHQLHGYARQVNIEPLTVPLTTDDWPFLYLREPSLPFAYLSVLPLLALVALGLARRVFTQWNVRWHFFFLGAAFLLMEVRIITQVALLFGTTWLVNAIAIAAVLVMALLANVGVALRKPTDVRPWGVVLVTTLAATILVPIHTFLNFGPGGSVLAVTFLAIPIFSASVIFSIWFRRVENAPDALASNLIGSVVGGLLEYASLLLGLGSLGWIALGLYLLALLTANRSVEH